MAGVVVLAGCSGDAASPAPGPAPAPAPAPAPGPERQLAAERVGRSVARYSDAIDSWKVSWTRASSSKPFDIEQIMRTRAGRAQQWAISPPKASSVLRDAAESHRTLAAKLFGPKDAALIVDLDRDAVTTPANAGRNALMSGALESSQRLREATEDLARAL
ncbi:MAG: hypothetical protein ACYTGX_14655, partial [Planctomycetota bacterium]